MFRERINDFIKKINGTSDVDCIDLIQDLVASAAEYISRVNNLEAAMLVAKITKDPQEYREYVQALDKQRSVAHNALIANVKAINRLCRSHSIAVIFEGNEDVRIEVADFALELTRELFSSRRL